MIPSLLEWLPISVPEICLLIFLLTLFLFVRNYFSSTSVPLTRSLANWRHCDGTIHHLIRDIRIIKSTTLGSTSLIGVFGPSPRSLFYLWACENIVDVGMLITTAIPFAIFFSRISWDMNPFLTEQPRALASWSALLYSNAIPFFIVSNRNSSSLLDNFIYTFGRPSGY